MGDWLQRVESMFGIAHLESRSVEHFSAAVRGHPAKTCWLYSAGFVFLHIDFFCPVGDEFLGSCQNEN